MHDTKCVQVQHNNMLREEKGALRFQLARSLTATTAVQQAPQQELLRKYAQKHTTYSICMTQQASTTTTTYRLHDTATQPYEYQKHNEGEEST